jgi:hypothetical protein
MQAEATEVAKKALATRLITNELMLGTAGEWRTSKAGKKYWWHEYQGKGSDGGGSGVPDDATPAGDGSGVGDAPLEAPTEQPVYKELWGTGPDKEKKDTCPETEALDTAARKVWKSLRPEERRALKDYTADSTDLNKYVTGELDKSEDPQLEAQTKLLDSVIDKHHIDENITVFRAIDIRSLGTATPGEGVTFKDPAYGSTTYLKDNAVTFLRSKNPRVMLKIDVPKGTRGVYFGPSGRSKFWSEREILLPRGTVYRVISSETTIHKQASWLPKGTEPDSYTTVHVQVLSK